METDELPRLAGRLPEIDTPVLIIAGRRDPVVPLANTGLPDEWLPDSRLVVVDAGHFGWEERPGEYASLIADRVTDGYRAAAGQGP